MEPIKRIVIIGASAMGAAYGAIFSDAPGFSVSFAVGGKRYEKLKNAQIMVNGRAYKIPAVRPDCIIDAPDLILVALKHHHLEDIKALTPKDLEDWIKVLDTLSPTGKTSMLQDMEAGRKTEVEIFAGSVTAMGEESKISTPVNKTFLNLIQVMEEKRWETGQKIKGIKSRDKESG